MTARDDSISLLRRPAVESRTGLSRSEIYRRIKAGTFPAGISLGAGSRAWPSNQIDAWIAEQIERDTARKAVA